MLKINEEKCKGCGLCAIACSRHKNIGIRKKSNSKGYFAAYDKKENCNSCGRCFMVCPDVAIEVEKNDNSIR